jgi:hypothetical protein
LNKFLGELKIRVSVVQFRPWAPLNLEILERRLKFKPMVFSSLATQLLFAIIQRIHATGNFQLSRLASRSSKLQTFQ